jgi:hypothetical protein
MVLDPVGAVITSAEFHRMLEKLLVDGPESAALRWAIVVCEDAVCSLGNWLASRLVNHSLDPVAISGDYVKGC